MADDIWTLSRSSRVQGARDAAHFELLRVTDVLRRPNVRRAVATVGVATVLAVALVVQGAVADEPRRAASAPAGVHAVGFAGSQTLEGSALADSLDGRAGDDVLLGGDGNDVLAGGGGHDVVHAGSGDDRLSAGAGRDVLLGGSGDDQLRASDQDGTADRLHCGPGNDTAWIVSVNGRSPDRTFDCEHVNVLTVRTVAR